jgi:hypothetical protein
MVGLWFCTGDLPSLYPSVRQCTVDTPIPFSALFHCIKTMTVKKKGYKLIKPTAFQEILKDGHLSIRSALASM